MMKIYAVYNYNKIIPFHKVLITMWVLHGILMKCKPLNKDHYSYSKMVWHIMIVKIYIY